MAKQQQGNAQDPYIGLDSIRGSKVADFGGWGRDLFLVGMGKGGRGGEKWGKRAWLLTVRWERGAIGASRQGGGGLTRTGGE